MAANILLEVVTPTGPAVKAEVDQVEAPSVAGEFGVLPGHLPLLAALRAGVVRYRSAGKISALAVGPGFAEAGGEKVTVLTDAAIDGTQVDVSAVRAQRDDVQKQLDAAANAAASESDRAAVDELTRQRDWLNAQLEAARESGKS